MSEPGHGGWAQALARAFALSERLSLNVASDVLPVAVLADLTAPPYVEHQEWAWGGRVVGGGGVWNNVSFGLAPGMPPGARLVIDTIRVNSTNVNTAVVFYRDPQWFQPYNGGEIQAKSTVPSRQGEEVGVLGWPQPWGGLDVPLEPLWREEIRPDTPYDIDGPFLVAPASALWVGMLLDNQSVTISARGRVYGL